MSTPLRKRALLIGTGTYQDESFSPLPCTAVDTAQLRQVLAHPAIGSFSEVRVVVDPDVSTMRHEIGAFTESLGPEDLGLLYISGHGVRLSRTTGEFFFIATDTDGQRVESTGVGASFVNEQLEQAAAPQKVAILDCCSSGGYSLGFRTRDAKSQEQPVAPITSRGVYVLSSSGADERSYGGGATPDGPTASVFTEELVDALRTGRGDTGNDGIVSVDELFHYVNQRVRKRDLPTPQTPLFSADKVNTRIDLARSYAGPPLPVVAASSPSPLGTARGSVVAENHGTGAWESMIDYYRRCLDAATSDMPLLSVDQVDEGYVCLPGTERLLSGDLDETGSIPLPEEAADFVEQGVQQEAVLWYGYPAVVLMSEKNGKALRVPRFAPMFIRRVEVVAGDDGLRLEPFGEPMPHRQLATDLLGEQEAQRMIETYQATWTSGMHSQMVQEIRHFLMEEFHLPHVQELAPLELEPGIDTRTPVQGARNAAVLFRVEQTDQANAQLLRDLKEIADNKDKIGQTALAALLGGASEQRTGPTWHPVTPFAANEGQDAVLRAAMTRRLTVATGPPGTGKSQLVANLAATAVANGQSVLVASTNNRAVDEVWERCQDVVVGSLVRTGNVDAKKKERETLRQLFAKQPSVANVSTATAHLLHASKALDSAVVEMAGKARLERDLLRLAEANEAVAADLQSTPELLRAHFAARIDLGALEYRARKAAAARFLGRWRRARFLRGINWTGEPSPDLCTAIGTWAKMDQDWQNLLAAESNLPKDEAQKRALDEHHEAVRGRSKTLLAASVAAGVQTGRQHLSSLLQISSGKDWSELRAVLKHIKGWAVTTLSVRRFPPSPALFDLVIVDEASQCAIPQVLPVLFRAKRALVIGDPMQLPPVVTLQPAQEAEIRRAVGMKASWLEERRATYHRHSAFHAFETAAGGVSLLLDEHFRCHPAIAAIANDQFYGGRLTVMTDVASQRRMSRPAVIWADERGTARRARGGSWTNEREAKKVEDSVKYLLDQLPGDATIGVVTPYKPQARLLANRLPKDDRIQVGTVHTFQGSQRDVILFSLVATKEMPAGSRAWLANQLYLWNVAITRARAHLIVVGDRGFWRTQTGVGRVLVDAAANASDQRVAADSELDPLLLRLHEQLSGRADAECSLHEVVSGYVTDAMVTDSSGKRTILLDRGHGSLDPARHLRLQYERQRLLAQSGHPATRVPAWRLFDSSSGSPILQGAPLGQG
nr:AAA domain-containing protein [Kibdelosporangium sp. MJ126-NF4]CEL17343.1 DNA helicase [Kibdelosporangium sp. MJ126-NF4]CTQ91429.1 DNA helicase [Kibdelosporangium sp. MJ126-NF4]